MNTRIFPAIAFMGAVAIFFFYVNPMWTGTIATARAAIAQSEQALLAAKKYSAQQNQLAAARDAIDPANISALSTFLPDSVDNVGLILDLNALAARSGMSVSNIDVITNTTKGDSPNAGALPAADVNPVNSVDLSLSAIGTFSALKSFIIGIEKSARLLDIHDLSVRGSETGVYTYDMTIRLYWLR